MKTSTPPQKVDLPFSKKYNLDHSRRYLEKHRAGIAHRLTDWREQAIAKKALKLAGSPDVVLDLPCGAGRFWEMLAAQPGRRILAADQSEAMLQVAQTSCDPALLQRVRCFQTSAFDIGLEDNTVDCVFCMRLLHHIGDSRHRLMMLKEFHRVSRDTVCISLWTDGNYKAHRRHSLERRRQQQERESYQNRFVLSRETLETEFGLAGFRILGWYDLFKYYAMWRLYVLRKR